MRGGIFYIVRTVPSEDGWGRENWRSPHSEVDLFMGDMKVQTYTTPYITDVQRTPSWLTQEIEALLELFPESYIRRRLWD